MNFYLMREYSDERTVTGIDLIRIVEFTSRRVRYEERMELS